MKTLEQDYLKQLHKIQNPNQQTGIIRVPADEHIYTIDLDTRLIESPPFLGTKFDHNAETIYFAVDRFYDNVDLSALSCVIQYQNANPQKSKSGYYYSVPYFDISGPDVPEGKMLLQWAVEGPATAYEGKVVFSIQFYKTSTYTIETADGTPLTKYRYDYVLNTLPALTKVYETMQIESFSENYIFEASEAIRLFEEIQSVRKQNKMYWIDLSQYDPLEPLFQEKDNPEQTINKNSEIYSNITS